MRNIPVLFVFCWLNAGLLSAQTPLEKAKVYFDGGDYKQAAEFYQQGLASGDDLNALVNLAHCHRYLAQWQRAEAAYAKASVNPTFSTNAYWVHVYFYAEILKNNGKLQEARKWLEVCKKHQPFIAEKALESLAFAEQYKDTAPAYRIKAETEVNTASAEFAPVFFKGNLVAFASTRPVLQEKLGGYTDPAQTNFMFKSERSAGGKLGKPKAFQPQSDLQLDQRLAPMSFTQDGKQAVSTFNSFKEGFRHLRGAGMCHADSRLELGLHVLEAGDVTGTPSNFPHNKANFSTGFPALSADGTVLYFSSDRDGGAHGFDLYVSYLRNGAWSEPQTLGENVNTIGDEISPFIASDGTLYFASDFHRGFGGYDIFSARRDAKGVWGDVRNLGPLVNSPYDDLYFVYDEASSVGYFASNRPGGAGDYDIYSCVRTGDVAMWIAVAENKASGTTTVTTPSNNSNNNNTNTGNGGNTGNLGNTNTSTNTTANPGTVATVTNNTGGGTAFGGNNLDGGNPAGGDVPCGLNFYIGAVVDELNQKPLDNVAVFILNEKTQKKEKVFTNRFGEYSLYLDPQTYYTIGLSAAGYRNTQFTVYTDIGGQKTLLGTRGMAAVATKDLFTDPKPAVSDKPIVRTETTPTGGNPFGPTNTATSSSGGKTTGVTTQPAERKMPDYKYSLAPSKPVPAQGYYVQLGIFSKLEDAKKDELRQYGNLYTEDSGVKTVYRLGIYADAAHAKSIAAELDKLGYKGAYALRTELGEGGSLASKLAGAQVLYPVGVGESPLAARDGGNPQMRMYPEPTPSVVENNRDNWADNDGWKGTQTAADFKEFKEPTGKKGVEFKVQLGAFQYPEKISFAHLADLGPLEKQALTSTGLTHFYIGGFTNIDQARRARTSAEQRGVQGPFVIAYKDGKRVDIKEVLGGSK